MGSKIRTRILTTATQCFAEHGFHGCSTKEIAARADVTEGSLFRLFESKEKLFGEALGLAITRLLPHSELTKRLAHPDFNAAILDACTAMYLKAPRQAIRITAYAYLEEKGNLVDRLRPHLAARVSAISSRIRVAIKAEQVRRSTNPKEAARRLLRNILVVRLQSLVIEHASKKAAVEAAVQSWLSDIAG
jgi:AcrR family transcriptional regulator